MDNTNISKDIFSALRGWLVKLGISQEVIRANQKAPLPNKAFVAIDPMQITTAIGHNIKTEPKKNLDGTLQKSSISEHEVEAMLYFCNSLDDKEDMSYACMWVQSNACEADYARFESSEDYAIKILRVQPAPTTVDINGAEYRRQYSLRVNLMYCRLWRKTIAPIESVELSADITNKESSL